MSTWAKILSLLRLTRVVRTPEEQKLDHTLRGYETAMHGAAHRAERIATRLKDTPKASELRQLREQSVSTIEALAREMQRR